MNKKKIQLFFAITALGVNINSKIDRVQFTLGHALQNIILRSNPSLQWCKTGLHAGVVS